MPLAVPAPTDPKISFVVFSGDLDKLIAAFIIANGAIAMGEEVSMFFTFWGLNALRRTDPPKRKRSALDSMFGKMMPQGAEKLTLSQMHMMGAGTAMIKSVMKKNGVHSLPELIASAQFGGARLIGCTMTMDLLGIAESDLIDNIELGGVATFLGEAAEVGHDYPVHLSRGRAPRPYQSGAAQASVSSGGDYDTRTDTRRSDGVRGLGPERATAGCLALVDEGRHRGDDHQDGHHPQHLAHHGPHCKRGPGHEPVRPDQ